MVQEPRSLRFHAVALFVFLAGAAWAGVVAPDLIPRAALAGLAGARSPGHAGMRQFALLLFRELLFELVNGGLRSARGHGNLARRLEAAVSVDTRDGMRGAGHRRCGRNFTPRLRSGIDWLAVGPDDLHPEEEPRRVFLELQHHGLEHVEGFLLVGHERILLRITAQPDAFLQV